MKSGILNSKLDDTISYVLNLADEELGTIKRCWDFNKHKKTILITTDIKVPFVNPETNDLLFFNIKTLILDIGRCTLPHHGIMKLSQGGLYPRQ